MALAQSAGALAILELENKQYLHDVPYPLKLKLLNEGQVLGYSQPA